MMNGDMYSIIFLVAALVLLRRTRTMFKPIRGTGLRILIPVFAIIPGFAVILNPNLELWQGAAALVVGIALSLPLIWTTNYELREDGNIYSKKNLGFVFAFLGVLSVRLLLRQQLEILDISAHASLLIAMAAGYVISWRLVSYIKFRRVYQTNANLA